MFDEIARRGLVLLGCGKMGSAMLAGWLNHGLPPGSVWASAPAPSDWVRETGVYLNARLQAAPDVVLISSNSHLIGKGRPT